MFTCKQCGKLFPKTRKTRAKPVYCSRDCLYTRRPDDPARRFWAKVEKSEGDGCWTWTAHVDDAGYGQFQLNRRPEKAHRVAYMLTNGTIPKGMEVCHHCDNPSCVRPGHLWLGTPKDNGDDRNRKGRHKAKLTWEQACAIRTRYKPRVITAKALASEYNISVSAVRMILTGELWGERPWRVYCGK